jgi:7-carboxy-7-deazaguanine synthase
MFQKLKNKITRSISLKNKPLKIYSIYFSIQGEGSFSGLPCIFVRMSGCNLRCIWCDTKDAYSDGKSMHWEDINKLISRYHCNLIELTGGEPLNQKNSLHLIKCLEQNGYSVLLETNGTYPIDSVSKNTYLILDVKCPGSGESEKNYWPNLQKTRDNIEYKFVIKDSQDFQFMLDCIHKYDLLSKGKIYSSPVFSVLQPDKLAEWILHSGLDIRINLQIHKYIWSQNHEGI